MEKITAIRGFKDILRKMPPLLGIESIARRVFNSFGFSGNPHSHNGKDRTFQTEHRGKRRILSKKKLYTFADRDTELLTLRPEATASVIRAYIEHNMSADQQ